MSRPVFQATPVRPSRQPSLHSSARGNGAPYSPSDDARGEPMPQHGGASRYPGYAADPYASTASTPQPQQYGTEQQGGYAHGGDYSPHTQHQPAFAQPGVAYSQDEWAAQDSYAAHPADTGLRHRTGESVSYGKPVAPFMSMDPRPSQDESVYSYQKGGSGWDAGGSHFEASSSTTHLAPGANSPHWENGYAGGHEAIQMQQQHMPAPGSGFYPPGPPPAADGWGYGAYAHNDYNAGAGAGWVGLAAPGTMLAQPQMPMHQYREPGALEQTRERILRRRTVKRLELTQGNLVIESPIAASLCKPGQATEFSKVRYQAVTSDPDEFVSQRHALRPWLLGRRTELAIVLTSYNEDDQLLYRTLGGVIKNIAYLASREKSKTWGAAAWQRVVVVIVADGRSKMNSRYANMLQVMGVYQPGLMVDHVNHKPVTAHLFELTTQVIVNPAGAVEVSPVPVQLLFCLKEKNQKKINSHRWFFNAFCAQLDPHVTVLLDVGTKPASRAIYHLWKAFSNDDRIGGACGEITVETGRGCWLLVNPLVAAQNFEYKMSNILDKPSESVFGFISVLPGAFSAYRYKAVQGAPLETYFKGERYHSGALKSSSFTANMFLAEDRLLCFELVTCKKAAWLLKYVKAATASTDVPDRLPEFISQRRRWLNGSLFASMFSLWHFGRLWTSGQPFLRKLLLTFQTVYNLVLVLFSLTSIANFYLSLYMLAKSATSDPATDPFGGQGEAILQVVLNVLLGVIVITLILSLGNRPQGSILAYHLIAVALAVVMCLGLYTAGWTIYIAVKAAGLTKLSGWTTENIVELLELNSFRAIVISLAATYVLWLAGSLLALDPWHVFTCIVQYLLLQPTFIVVLSIFSLANTHDISWGTKGDSSAATDLGSATVKDGKDGKAAAVEIKAPSAQDAQELWASAQAELAIPQAKTKNHRSASVKAADAAATFRTNLLLLYVALNAALIITFSSTWWARFVRRNINDGRAGQTDPYMNAIFYSVAGLAAVRFLGALMYTILRIVGR